MRVEMCAQLRLTTPCQHHGDKMVHPRQGICYPLLSPFPFPSLSFPLLLLVAAVILRHLYSFRAMPPHQSPTHHSQSLLLCQIALRSWRASHTKGNDIADRDAGQPWETLAPPVEEWGVLERWPTAPRDDTRLAFVPADLDRAIIDVVDGRVKRASSKAKG
eukprot:6173064-Pleurochrysis_carterae.AAC.4